MSVAMSLWVAVALSSTDVGVVLTKRSGVSKQAGASRAKLVRDHLKISPEVEDLTSCQSRLPCVLKTARERKWGAVVTVETANVLNDAIIDVRLLSVEEDGREVARGNLQGPEASLAGSLETRLEAIRKALVSMQGTGATAEPMVPPPPPPLPEPTRVEPAPVAVATAPAPPPERPAARWVPLGLSLAITVAGGLFLGISESMAQRLRMEVLDQPNIDALVSTGSTLRTVGWVGLAAGGTLSVASLVLALVWPEPRLAPSAFWLPGGGGLALGGTFP